MSEKPIYGNMADDSAEAAVLAAMLYDNAYVHKLSFLCPDDFSNYATRAIFEKITERVQAGEQATPLSLKSTIDDLNLDCGSQYLAYLAGRGYHDSHMAMDAGKQLVEWRRKREIFAKIEDVHHHLIGESSDDIIADLAGTFLDMQGTSPAIPLVSFKKVASAIVESMREDLPCYSTGLACLDKSMSGGMYEKRSYCIAARPKAGKTMMLTTISGNMAEAGISHVFIAAEMGANEIHQRLLAARMNRNSLDFMRKHDESSMVPEYAAKAASSDAENCYYVDAPGITFDQLRQAVYAAIKTKKVKGFILDYLQLVTGKNRNQTDAEFQAQVAQWIAQVCKKEKIWALYAAQINREGNIRGSDGIVMAADQIYHLEKNKDTGYAWMQQLASRYTMALDVGDESFPALRLNVQRGPKFEDVA